MRCGSRSPERGSVRPRPVPRRAISDPDPAAGGCVRSAGRAVDPGGGALSARPRPFSAPCPALGAAWRRARFLRARSGCGRGAAGRSRLPSRSPDRERAGLASRAAPPAASGTKAPAAAMAGAAAPRRGRLRGWRRSRGRGRAPGPRAAPASAAAAGGRAAGVRKPRSRALRRPAGSPRLTTRAWPAFRWGPFPEGAWVPWRGSGRGRAGRVSGLSGRGLVLRGCAQTAATF